MTLAQSGTLPSVLQSPVETLTWKSSSLLNKRGEEQEEEERGQRARREETEEGDKERRRQSTMLSAGQEWRRGTRSSEGGGQRGGDDCHFAASSCKCYVNNQYAITARASKGGKETTASRHRSLSRKVPRDGDPSSGAPTPDTHQSIAASLWDTGIVI